MKLIVGLGNPGKKYEATRHNIGFLALERLAESFRCDLQDDSKFKGEWGFVTDTTHDKIFFLKPMTYMNLSGESVAALAKFYKILPEDILVIHDEIDLPLGRIRVARGGGAAGNNGIRSTIQHLGTQKFPRLRLGVGRPQHPGQSVADYVLQKFSKAEHDTVDSLLQKALEATESYLQNGLDPTMNEFNQKS